MPRCYESLAVAASSNRNSAENRLTELYAAVLEAHRGFARLILQRAGLDASESYRVFTQEILPASGRIDMVVRGFDSSGVPAMVLYSEHKEPGGRWQDGQPDKYLLDLNRASRHGAQSRLLVIVGSRKDVVGRVRYRARWQANAAVGEANRFAGQQNNPRIAFTTRQELGGLAEQAGQDTANGDTTWRTAAARPDAPAAQRILLELLWYLEEEGYVVTKPLTHDHLAIFHQAEELDASLGAIVAGGGEAAR
jgi:hypothetical protein